MLEKIRSFFKESSEKNRYFTISNGLTSIRFFLTPFLVHAILLQQWTSAVIILGIAGVTDILDGYVARLLNEDTLIGRYLDPLADKVLLVSSFFALSYVQVPFFPVPLWFAFFVLVRELIMISGAILFMFLRQAEAIKPTILGKLTTFFHILFIVVLFLCYLFQWSLMIGLHVMLSMLVGLSVFSLLHYIKIAITLAWRGKGTKKVELDQ